jgi:hypothetical protein
MQVVDGCTQGTHASPTEQGPRPLLLVVVVVILFVLCVVEGLGWGGSGGEQKLMERKGGKGTPTFNASTNNTLSIGLSALPQIM